MSELKPCKHLDYAGEYVDCRVETCAPHYPNVRYWARGERWTAGGNPRNVQFCGAGRGRINGIFQCYNGEMHCYEPEEQRPDPRDPDYTRPGIFATHNCWKCRDGQQPCAQGAPHRCEYPHARND